MSIMDTEANGDSDETMGPSPRPWKVGRGYEQSERGNYIASAEGVIVAAEQDGTDCVMTTEDRDLIVTAVNQHDGLVRDRDELLAALKTVIAESDRNTDPYIAARALIARIEGGVTWSPLSRGPIVRKDKDGGPNWISYDNGATWGM